MKIYAFYNKILKLLQTVFKILPFLKYIPTLNPTYLLLYGLVVTLVEKFEM